MAAAAAAAVESEKERVERLLMSDFANDAKGNKVLVVDQFAKDIKCEAPVTNASPSFILIFSAHFGMPFSLSPRRCWMKFCALWPLLFW
jgi:hypothetical protein